MDNACWLALVGDLRLAQEQPHTESCRLGQENDGSHIKEEEGMLTGAADLDRLCLHTLARLGRRAAVLKYLGWAERWTRACYRAARLPIGSGCMNGPT